MLIVREGERRSLGRPKRAASRAKSPPPPMPLWSPHGSRQSLAAAAYVAAFLVLAIMLGGSSRAGFYANAALQAIAATAIAILLLLPLGKEPVREQRQLVWFVGACALLPVLQLVPMPYGWWSALPGHMAVADLQVLLDPAGTWMPLTLDRDATIASLLAWLPPASIVLAMLRVERPHYAFIAGACLLVTLAGVALAAIQVAHGPQSPFYLYDYTSFGRGTGFFANANHQGLLCVMCIMLPVAIVNDMRSRLHRGMTSRKRQYIRAMIVVTIIVMLALFAGALLTGSRMALLLGGPALLLGMFQTLKADPSIKLPPIPALPPLGWGAIVLALLAIVLLLGFYFPPGLGGADISRMTIWANSVAVGGRFAPLGSGFGTFSNLYAMMEPPAQVGPNYVNHAHNDYLEIIVEGGAGALLLLLGALAGFARCVSRILSATRADPYLIVSASAVTAFLLASLVEYPGRTAAISCMVAFFSVIIAGYRRLSYVIPAHE